MCAAERPAFEYLWRQLENFVERLHESRSNLYAAAVRSLVSMRLQEVAAVESAGGDASAMREALASDFSRVADFVRGTVREGDEVIHLEWLCDHAWLQAHHAAQSDQTDALSLCRVADLLDASCTFAAALPATESRLQTALRGRSVLARCWCRLAAVDPAMAQQPHHANRARDAMAEIRRLRERLRVVLQRPPSVHADVLLALEIEVAIRRDEDAAPLLRIAAETKALSADQLRQLAEIAHEHGHTRRGDGARDGAYAAS